MANPEKHKRNDLLEWLEEEESSAPARPRGARIVGGHGKTPAGRKSRAVAANGAALKVEPALVREPGPPAKIDAKHSQASSPDHLRKQQRLFNLRAPHSKSAAKLAPGARG